MQVRGGAAYKPNPLSCNDLRRQERGSFTLEYTMTKLKNKEYKVKYKEDDECYGAYITYIDGECEKLVYFTYLEHEIKFTDLLREAGYTYVASA